MKEKKLQTKIRFRRKILFLTQDTSLIRKQLKEYESLEWDPDRPRMDKISTDEITPAWACFHYDETLSRYVYTGIRGQCIQQDDIAKFAPEVVVCGRSKGTGSSREAAPYAEMLAGIKLVIADSFEKIYRQNAANIGLYTSTNLGLIDRIAAGEMIPIEELIEDLDDITKTIIRSGGPAEYTKARVQGQVTPPKIDTAPRPMTISEKIVASHASLKQEPVKNMRFFVKPGDALFIKADIRFSHEYVTAMSASIFERWFGAEAKISDPDSVVLFRDHLTFLESTISEEHKKIGLLDKADDLAVAQQSFADKMNLRLIGEVPEGGSESICHNAIVETIGYPGQVIVGTDSHTCTAGALGALGFGVGSSDMALLWRTVDTRIDVPESVKVHLSGSVPENTTAKDLILFLMNDSYISSGRCVGKILEFTGAGLKGFCVDERATIANMAVEIGALTAIVEPDDITVSWLNSRSRPPSCFEKGIDDEVMILGVEGKLLGALFKSDPDAVFAKEIHVDLDSIEPMVATPGSPRNAARLSELNNSNNGPLKIDIAYAGSCTGGKMRDMDMYAQVLESALARGFRVAPGVRFYIQFGSQAVKEYARKRGYLELFKQVGATMLDPACGACIGAGPGVSTNSKMVTISAGNRNFPGRSGPGEVYLASPYVVAASAITGFITAPSF